MGKSVGIVVHSVRVQYSYCNCVLVQWFAQPSLFLNCNVACEILGKCVCNRSGVDYFDLLLVENAHLLFIFADGSYMDFLLHRPIAERLSCFLAEYGIKWAARMEFQFDSCILYPPAYAGQKFYNPDGSTRSDIAL